MKKLDICINSAFILNINSLEYYEKLVKEGLISEINENNDFKMNKINNIIINKKILNLKLDENNKINPIKNKLNKKLNKEINKNNKTNFILLKNSKNNNEVKITTIYSKILEENNQLNSEKNEENINFKNNKLKKIDCVFNEDLILICDEMINISKLLDNKNNIKDIEEIKEFFLNNKILKYDVEILKICEEINNKIDNFKNKEIKEITNLEINSIINNLNKIKEIIEKNTIDEKTNNYSDDE